MLENVVYCNSKFVWTIIFPFSQAYLMSERTQNTNVCFGNHHMSGKIQPQTWGNRRQLFMQARAPPLVFLFAHHISIYRGSSSLRCHWHAHACRLPLCRLAEPPLPHFHLACTMLNNDYTHDARRKILHRRDEHVNEIPHLKLGRWHQGWMNSCFHWMTIGATQ